MLFIDEAYARRGRNEQRTTGWRRSSRSLSSWRTTASASRSSSPGTPEEMETFLSTNPGLRSRFPTVIDFPDYTTDQIVQIVDSI